MADLMIRNKYRDACRYRMRETLENLLEIWNPDTDEEVVTIENINEAIDILGNTIDELKYFREKIKTTEEIKY